MWKVCSEWQSWSKQSDNTASCSGSARIVTWKTALELVNNHTFPAIDGYSDWRLPNVKELASLVALDRFKPSINSTIFPNTPGSFYQSSSPAVFGSNSSRWDRWLVKFDVGFYQPTRRKKDPRSIRLVRLGR
jgi:hypothetical protein